jgi:hypothetical protein
MSESLYLISKNYMDLFNRLEVALNDGTTPTDEVVAVADELTITEENLKDKSLNYLRYIQCLESDNLGIDNEIKRLQALKKSKLSVIANLKGRLKNALLSLNMDKLDLGIFKLSFKKSQSTETEGLKKILGNLDLKTLLIENFDTSKIMEVLNNDINFKKYSEFLKLEIDFSISGTKVKKYLEANEENKIEGCYLDKKDNLQIK